MKVLHLAPSPTSPDALTAHTFIDEEILALRDHGVDGCLVADGIPRSEIRQRISIVRLPRPAPAAHVAQTVALGVVRAHLLSMRAFQRPRHLLHALRIEQTAADVAVRERVDLIHSHFGWPAGFGGLLAAAHAGVPLVASLRGMDLLTHGDIEYGLRQDPFYDAGITRLLHHAARTIYATEFMRTAGLRAGAVPDRTVVVRKGVDLDRFRPPSDRAVAQRALGVDGPMILAVGTLGARKGYRTILGALGRLRRLRWHFVVCGEGPDRTPLAELAHAAGIADRIRFAGLVSRADIPRYFAAADILVHAPILEAAGNVVLEGLASGCAVVATDSGGPPEYVRHGETGLIVPPENPGALAQALMWLLRHPELRKSLAAAARRHAECKLSYNRMVTDLLSVYSDVLLLQGSRASRALRPRKLRTLGP